MYRAGHAGCPAPGATISGPTNRRWDLNPDCREEKEKERTWRDFKLGRQLNRFIILDNAPSGRVVGEALEMEDEYRWKRVNEHCDWLARFTGSRAGRTDMRKSWLSGVRECVLNGMY